MWTTDDIRDLYRRHAFAVFRRCKHLLRLPDEANDVMQEVFVKLLETPERFEGRSSPSTYLFALATHLCLTRRRAQALRGEVWQAAVARSLEDEQPRNADAVEARQLLVRVLSEADEETAAMAIYFFVDGLSLGEIASLTGRSRVTVNQKLQRFREAARARQEAR